MPHLVSHWDNESKKRLFGIGVEAMVLSIQGRTEIGGPHFSYSENWISNLDIQELSDIVEEYGSYDQSDGIVNAREYILSREDAIFSATKGLLERARTGDDYWMFT